jgi:hypothetical protein
LFENSLPFVFTIVFLDMATTLALTFPLIAVFTASIPAGPEEKSR